jgi:hypothetical protein
VLAGITVEPLDDGPRGRHAPPRSRRATWTAVPLERAPKVAIYTPADGASRGTTRDAGAHPTRHPVREGSGTRRCSTASCRVRLGAPLPRGLHRQQNKLYSATATRRGSSAASRSGCHRRPRSACPSGRSRRRWRRGPAVRQNGGSCSPCAGHRVARSRVAGQRRRLRGRAGDGTPGRPTPIGRCSGRAPSPSGMRASSRPS